ncbi:MAG: hypothetical protein HY543_01195 [Deltaproteobacteria bacterium]|nr:hypothetical protein [Deltaproteobacteria bacterium]
MRGIVLLVLVMAAQVVAACARQPSVPQAERVMQQHFRRYAKRYSAGVFGASPVTRVTLSDMEELHKHYVAAAATVAFQDGRSEAVRCSLERRPPLGWKVVSWERLTP